ncbi:MAG TPA: flotillin family protein, partial [Bacteroidia bacterium]
AIIDAEAEAEKIRREAKGQADAIFAKMEAEAKGIYEILTKQAEGYQRIVEAAGGDPSQAVTFLIADKLPELVRTQVEAVKNIKIDKITVWDGNNNANGNTSTSNFISGMMKSVPPLNDLFSMAGLELPTYLKGKSEQNSETTNTEEPNSEE